MHLPRGFAIAGRGQMSVEALLPERAVPLDPVGGGAERFRVEAAVVDPPFATPLEEPGLLEDFQVSGNRG